MRFTPECREEAVSPVVGVMLMLVVTLIIAAVVSGFAGDLASSQKKTPTITMTTEIVNTGYYYGSGITMRVISVSEPIATGDLKIVTDWVAKNGERNSVTVLPNIPNVNYGSYNFTSPFATGSGVESFGLNNVKNPGQYFGNYTLTAGTLMRAYPTGAWGPGSGEDFGGYGVTRPTYEYKDGFGYDNSTDIDFIQAVLGKNWNNLREGDVVNVRLVHTPSGKVIYNEEVKVRGM
ncbi:type IV pilin [Methanofollis formosanus]|uniref:Type IV pilin n=1 Tax=Methanofollis formosanus TaxID=299308 RepID=A0A8G1A4B9_9EURY|nr:type IV pilin N-terminal domain-containing protein [Methanofollis formosanus]QYZ80169.1 type IV pilin [Methanofollis formosanus]